MGQINGGGLTGPFKQGPVKNKAINTFGKYVGTINLNVGCGHSLEEGFINLDRRPVKGAFRWDMEELPLIAGGTDVLHEVGPKGIQAKSDSVDCILASHVLEHIVGLIPLMREFHRVLKPGGHLIIVSPYASSDDAWEDPTHVRAFTEKTWAYFDKRLYQKEGHAGSYESDVDFTFEAVEVGLIPSQWAQQTADNLARQGHLNALEHMKMVNRNVIKEMIAVLRKVD